jgi:hypothetical protein
MEGIKYTCEEDRYGGMLITNIEAKKTCYLQGEDAAAFQEEWDAIVEMWTKKEKPFSVFTSYEKHIDFLCSAYDDVMKEEEGGNI